jgi:hypothetical protein
VGYLQDNLPFGQFVGDCPALYQYALIVQWVSNDPFFIPNAVDLLTSQLAKNLSDVEDWQISVLRARDQRIKFRFKDAATRDQAVSALNLSIDPSIRVTGLTIQNPPDRATRGVA